MTRPPRERYAARTPRQARLDAPGTLHHVMVRGIERTAIFRGDPDRMDFLARLGVSTSGIAKAVARAERREVH